MTFKNIGALYFIALLVPILIIFFIWAFNERVKLLSRLASASLLKRLVTNYYASHQVFKAGLLILAVTFLVLTTAQPRLGFHWEEVKSHGNEIYVALDLSKSMLAQDIAPSRLERAKRKIIDLLSMLEGDRIALIGFAGAAYLQCPLTMDQDAFKGFLDSMSTDSISNAGTAIEAPVLKVVEILKSRGNPEMKSVAIILFSDGEDHEGNISSAIARAKEVGLRVYSIGIGKTSGAPIPEESGGFKKSLSGELILTKLEEGSLKKFAVETGGSYIRSMPQDDDVTRIYADVRRQIAEREAVVGGKMKRQEERFQWPLFIAILCLFSEMLLGVNWGRAISLVLTKRFPTLNTKVISCFLVFLFCNHQAVAGWFDSEARAGEKAYEQGKFDDALDHFLKAQVENPNNANLRYNLANTYYKLGRFDEAKKQYEELQGLNSKDHNQQRTIRSEYNLGNTAFRLGEYDDAISHYENALKDSPSDEDAKYNLSLAQQMKASPPPPMKDSNSNQNENRNDTNKSGKSEQDREAEKNSALNDSQKNSEQDSQQSSEQDSQKEANAQQQANGQEPKIDEKPNRNNAQALDSAENAKDIGAMSKAEAESWLNQVREGKKKPAPSKTARAIMGGKDW